MFSKGNNVVVPIIFRNYLLQLTHNDTFHQGSAKTINRLMQCYYWFNLRSDVELLVRTCPTCQILGKDFKLQFAPLNNLPIVKDNGDTFIVDIMGPWPTCTKSDNRFVFTVTDGCSRFPYAFPIKQHTAENVADSICKVMLETLSVTKTVSCAEI